MDKIGIVDTIGVGLTENDRRLLDAAREAQKILHNFNRNEPAQLNASKIMRQALRHHNLELVRFVQDLEQSNGRKKDAS